jgi:PAS domain S-box-containing protein
LRESEERFRLFVENVTDYALVQVDPDRNISGWNTGAERSFGYTEEEIIGQPMSVLFRPEDTANGDVESDFQEALSVRRSECERWLVRKDDTTFWARWVTTPMYDDVGRLRGYAKVLRDETQRKQAEDQLRTALEQKKALVQEIHHRVKNNLQVISSLLSLQADRLENPEVAAVLQDTQTRVAAIAAIHEQLYASQDLSNIEFGPYVRRLVRGLFGLYGVNGDRIDLRLDAADIVLKVEQAIPLGLIINELVINALKHAFPQNRPGVITLSLTDTPANAEGKSVPEGLVRLRVEDNGVGLVPDIDIHQAKSMGLTLVNLLVQQLRGTVEDEAIVAADLQSKLQHLGYVVCGIAFSGADAIRTASETTPDLILMDVRLQGNMTGLEAAVHIRKRRHVPVVYITAYTGVLGDTVERHEKALYLSKPVSPSELKTVLADALQGRPDRGNIDCF